MKQNSAASLNMHPVPKPVAVPIPVNFNSGTSLQAEQTIPSQRVLRPIDKLTNSADGLPRIKSVGSDMSSAVTTEDIETQIHNLQNITIVELSKKIASVEEENIRLNDLLLDQKALIDRLISQNQQLEQMLTLQQTTMLTESQLTQRLANEREITANSITEIQQQIEIRLSQKEAGLTAQYTRINTQHTLAQQEASLFQARTTETEQKHHQELLTMFRGVETKLGNLGKTFNQHSHEITTSRSGPSKSQIDGDGHASHSHTGQTATPKPLFA